MHKHAYFCITSGGKGRKEGRKGEAKPTSAAN